jgi:uncharacterized paraquat-inducible protein A
MVHKFFDVSDVRRAQINLEPLKCRKCRQVGNVIYLQGVGDAVCENCGAWQLEYTKAGKRIRRK